MQASLFVLASIFAAFAPTPTDDAEEAVRRAALDYVDGFYAGELERIERGVHSSLQKLVVQTLPGGRETLEFMDRPTLVEYARLGGGRTPADARGVEVTVLDVLDHTAVVRIDSVGFTDHAQVVNLNGEWQVVNVLWAQKRGTPLAPVEGEDLAAIERAGFDYVDGFYAGSVERLEGALHPRLQKVTPQKLPNGREVLRYSTTDGLAEYMRTGAGRKPEAERAVEVELLAAEANVATIRIDSADFVDFAHVARVNGEWRIVNVLWLPRRPGTGD